MVIEIDQSNKIEQTDKDTIIGLSNGKAFTVIIKKQTKRKLQKEFRRQKQSRLFVYVTFIAGVVLLVNYSEIKNITEIIIDKEYLGYEKFLKEVFCRMYGYHNKKIPIVRFGNIGKKSNAHCISYFSRKGQKYKPNKEIGFDELRKLCFKQKPDA